MRRLWILCGLNGVLVPPFDLEDYAARLVKLKDDEAERLRMARNAVEKSKSFEMDKIAAYWTEMLVDLFKICRYYNERLCPYSFICVQSLGCVADLCDFSTCE